MTREFLIAAAIAATVPVAQASAQHFTCVMGMASSFSATGSSTGSDERDRDVSPNMDRLVAAASACGGRTFLSANPSLLRRDASDRGSWAMGLRGASMGMSGTLDRDRFVVGDETPAARGAAVPTDLAAVRLNGDANGTDVSGDQVNANGPSSAVPGAICAYLGGHNCVGANSGPGGGGGYGLSGNPGQTISQDPSAFVAVVQGANGSNSNGNHGSGNNGSGNNGSIGNGNGTGSAGTSGAGSGVTVLDVLDPGAQAAAIAPEPATMTLIASGLMGLALAGRRRRR